MVPRPLSKSAAVLCQKASWQTGPGTGDSACEEHSSETQAGDYHLPLAQLTRAYKCRRGTML